MFVNFHISTYDRHTKNILNGNSASRHVYLQCCFTNLSVSLYPCLHISKSTSGCGGKNAREHLYRFCSVNCMLVFRSSMWKSFEELSLGQMSLSPLKGETVMVSPSLKCCGRLSEIPPSTKYWKHNSVD